MSGHHVLTDHKGHDAQIIDEQTLRCTVCCHTLKLPKPADPRKVVEPPTPIPPRYTRPTGVVVPASSVPEWREVRQRLGRKP